MKNEFRLTPRSYGSFIKKIYENGQHLVDQEGNVTREIINAHLTLKNPIDRLMINDARKINFPFGVAEFLGLLTGEARVLFFSNFISSYDRYSTDGIYVDGAYGSRLADEPEHSYKMNGGAQIKAIIDMLSKRPSSRRAVAAIYDAHDLFGRGGVNTPCTLSLQFLIREDENQVDHLHAITTMRSNDAIWGLNYDLIMFTMLQEFVAMRLNGVALGEYFHNDGSLHLYERHFPLVEKLLESKRWPHLMPRMPIDFDFEEVERLRLAYFHVSEPEVFSMRLYDLKTRYAKDLALAAYMFYHRHNESVATDAFSLISNYTIRKVMKPWMKF